MTHLKMARIYRLEGSRSAAARSLIHAVGSARLAVDLPIAEFIIDARRYDGSVNAFAVRFLP